MPSTSTPSESSASVDSGRTSNVKAASRYTSRTRKLKVDTIESTRASTSSAAAPATSSTMVSSRFAAAPAEVRLKASRASTSSTGMPTLRLSAAFSR